MSSFFFVRSLLIRQKYLQNPVDPHILSTGPNARQVTGEPHTGG